VIEMFFEFVPALVEIGGSILWYFIFKFLLYHTNVEIMGWHWIGAVIFGMFIALAILFIIGAMTFGIGPSSPYFERGQEMRRQRQATLDDILVAVKANKFPTNGEMMGKPWANRPATYDWDRQEPKWPGQN
jgi:hypothetical protein